MNQIIMHPIGIIHSPYKESKNIPIQGIFKDGIKAYVKYFDSQDNVVSGWLDKHFKSGNIPDNKEKQGTVLCFTILLTL